MTVEILEKIRALRKKTSDINSFDQLLLIFLNEICGLSAGIIIYDYLVGLESDITTDIEACEIINDPLVHYISNNPTPLSILKTKFKDNSIIQGLIEYIEQAKSEDTWTY